MQLVAIGRLIDYSIMQPKVVNRFPDPYNIVKDGDYNYTIEMALAGYSKKDIEVEVHIGSPYCEVYQRCYRW